MKTKWYWKLWKELESESKKTICGLFLDRLHYPNSPESKNSDRWSPRSRLCIPLYLKKKHFWWFGATVEVSWTIYWVLFGRNTKVKHFININQLGFWVWGRGINNVPTNVTFPKSLDVKQLIAPLFYLPHRCSEVSLELGCFFTLLFPPQPRWAAQEFFQFCGFEGCDALLICWWMGTKPVVDYFVNISGFLALFWGLVYNVRITIVKCPVFISWNWYNSPSLLKKKVLSS